MVITRTVEMHAQLVGYDFKKKGLPTDKNIAVENSKVSNDYFWKTNKYTDQDVFGRTLDLTALINKPDGYLKGSLSDTEDVDYYEFNITEYRALSFAEDTYNKDITIILDHIPEGCDYEMVLYDEEGNQVGIGKENGNGGLSITIPNWNSDNRGYTVKVQAKNGSTVNPDAEYHLSFQTKQADKRVQLRKSGRSTKPIIQSRWRNCIRNRQKMLCRVGQCRMMSRFIIYWKKKQQEEN